MLPVLRDTGCLFVTTAVEAVQDEVLQKLDKGHTRADFVTAARLFRNFGLTLAPTFIPFTPWTTAAGFRELLDTVEELGLTENVSPVQWSLRLLITSNSRLLELEDVRGLIGEFDPRDWYTRGVTLIRWLTRWLNGYRRSCAPALPPGKPLRNFLRSLGDRSRPAGS